MTNSAELLRQDLHRAGIIDPEFTHHVFGQGLHGQKISFNSIEDDSELYQQWVQGSAAKVEELYPQNMPDVIIGVSSGTNRLAFSVAQELGSGILVLTTAKRVDARDRVELTADSKSLLTNGNVDSGLVLEDVGTTGKNALSAAQSALDSGVGEVRVLNTWQRSATLVLLDEAKIPYSSMIKEIMPTYTPEACKQNGLCAQGWELIPYKK